MSIESNGDGTHVPLKLYTDKGTILVSRSEGEPVAVELADGEILVGADNDNGFDVVDSASLGGASALQIDENLADLDDAEEARDNLGLGTAAVLDTGFGANNVVKLSGTPGTPDGTKFIRDDGTFQAVAGGGGGEYGGSVVLEHTGTLSLSAGEPLSPEFALQTSDTDWFSITGTSSEFTLSEGVYGVQVTYEIVNPQLSNLSVFAYVAGGDDTLGTPVARFTCQANVTGTLTYTDNVFVAKVTSGTYGVYADVQVGTVTAQNVKLKIRKIV